MLAISSVGAPFLAGSDRRSVLIARRLVAAGEDFRAADQDAWIDAEGVADKAEHDDGADAEPAATHRQAEAAATAHSAATVAATVIDLVAAAEIIVNACGFSSFQHEGGAFADTQHGSHVKFPSINQ